MNFSDFKNELSEFPWHDIVFVGLGNELRGDDGAGLYFIDLLQGQSGSAQSHFIKAGANPENYLEQILACRSRAVVFIDAARFGGQPGELRWLEPSAIDTLNISTHAFSIKMVEAYLQAHQDLDYKYLGIEPRSTDFGTRLSSEIKTALERFFQPDAHVSPLPL